MPPTAQPVSLLKAALYVAGVLIVVFFLLPWAFSGVVGLGQQVLASPTPP